MRLQSARGVEITFSGNRFTIRDPVKVDMLIKELIKGRLALWGPQPDSGGEYRCREADRGLAGVALADPRPTPESRGAHPLPRRRNYEAYLDTRRAAREASQGASGNPG